MLDMLFSKEGCAVERQDGKVSDQGIFFVAGIFVFGVLAFLASRSAVVLHRIELPLLRAEARILAWCPMGEVHGMELSRIENILAVVDTEVMRTGNYTRINGGALRRAVTTASRRTRKTGRILACTLLCFLGSLVMAQTFRVRRRLYDSRESVRAPDRRGIEGFLRATEDHLDPGMKALLSKAPTPENLIDAFTQVRAKVNIPCSVVARLFGRGTGERMALLGYGKTRVAFADEEMGSGICRNETREEV